MENFGDNIESLEKLIDYKFNQRDLLLEALTHRSFAYEQGDGMRVRDNERLEFLGDAVLELAVSHLLFDSYPHYSEGHLSRLRSAIVSEGELARWAERFQIGKYLILGKGEEHTGGRKKSSILSGTVEALLGAIYIDGGWEQALYFVKKHFFPYFSVSSSDDPLHELDRDYKTKLQEWFQGQCKRTPVYRLDKEEGPDHDKTFYVSVMIDGKVLARGRGKSKKEAQQRAAQVAYTKLAKKDVG